MTHTLVMRITEHRPATPYAGRQPTVVTMMTNMVTRREWTVVGVAEAKAKISELLERVSRGERIVVARRGKTVAVLAPPDAVSDGVAHPRGLATLAGVLADWPAFDSDMDQVVDARRTARDRGVPDLE